MKCKWRRATTRERVHGRTPVVGRTEDYNLLSEIYRPGDGGDRSHPRNRGELAGRHSRSGAPIAATDGNGDALTFALTGASAFVIDAASGQIRVAEGAVLDYETKDFLLGHGHRQRRQGCESSA